jgi:hypothetical protein
MRYTHYGVGHPAALREITRACVDADLSEDACIEWESGIQPYEDNEDTLDGGGDEEDDDDDDDDDNADADNDADNADEQECEDGERDQYEDDEDDYHVSF